MRLGLLLIVFLLAACATPYQPMGYRGGYDSLPLTANRAKIGFAGNANTSPGFVRNAALLRAAEYTVEQGYDWFGITEDRGRTKQQMDYTAPSSPNYVQGYPATAAGYYQPASLTVSNRHEVVFTIVMGNGPAPGDAWPAQELANNLGARLK